MILNTQITLGKAKTDSYIDACGYIACAGEIATRREVPLAVTKLRFGEAEG